MLLVLDDNHKNHLELLKNIDPKVFKEFCRISVEHLKRGSNQKEYQSASQKLNIDVDLVQNAIFGIMHLYTEAAKIMIEEIEFRDSVILLGLDEDKQNELIKCYLENREEIRLLLTSLNLGIPHYRNLEWRLDVQIASRSLRHMIKPTLLMSLELEQEEGKPYTTILETDPANLLHMTEVLDHALQEAKSQHSRRIMRGVK